MKYGMCMQIDAHESVKIIKEAGFDYVECGFCKLSRADDETFEIFRKALIDNDIRCEAANGFFPKDIPLIGDKFDEKKTAEYMERGMKRGAEIGLKTVVFGSSGARAVPLNIGYAEGFRQLGKILHDVISPMAKKYGIKIVMEPLRKDECNIINTVKEGTMLAVLSDTDNVFCLADIYHMIGEGDTFEDIRQLKGSIRHSHISNPFTKKDLKRDFPADMTEFDYAGFIDALKFAGCETCSVEAQCIDFQSEAIAACKLLKRI